MASLVLSCLFGFVWELTVFSVGSVNEAHLSPLVANLAVAAALVGLVLYARTRINLDLAYRIIVPVIVVLFAVLPFFWETNPVALNIIMSASYGLFDVIIWSLVAACSYDFAVSGYIVGGIVRSLSVLLRLVGMGIGFLITLVPGQLSARIVTAMRTWTGWQSRRRSEGRPPCQLRPLPQHRNRHRHPPHPKPLPRRPPTMPSRPSTPPSPKTTASPAARPRCCPSWLAAAPPR